jgi:hypothetical protein
MSRYYEVWILRKQRKVLITEFPGVPLSVCGYMSAEAQRNAEARGNPTVSEIGFRNDDYLGEFQIPIGGGWGDGEQIAKETAAELGFEIEYEADIPFSDDDDLDEYKFTDDYDEDDV